MGSKLRPMYDKLYIGVEVWLQAREARLDEKKYARTFGRVPEANEDYVRLVRPYWSQFRVSVPKKYWYVRYRPQGRPTDPRYIPGDLWFQRIIPFYNNLIFAKALQDKCLLDTIVPDMRHPVTVVKCINGVFYDRQMNILSRQEAAESCRGHGRVIVKPSVNSGQGHGIRFYDSDGLTSAGAEDIFRQYGKNFIMQEKLAQHEAMARFNAKSLNTVRVLTFLYGGQVHILSTILRVGGETSEVDNVSQGGFQCTILPDGTLDSRILTKRRGKWELAEAGVFGAHVEGSVPFYDRVVASVRRAAARMAHFPILGWDIALDREGEPVLIEYNVIPGQNQGSDGPTFGDLTDQVLTEVFGRKK